MAIVSISEASRLTGKNRRTIQRHITAGKLSRAAGIEGIDTSELIRFYGAFIATPAAVVEDAAMSQETALIAAPVSDEKDIEIMQLKAQVEKLQAVLEVKNEHIESLNKAMLILEHKAHTETPAAAEKPQEALKKSVFSRFLWFKK